MGKTRPGAAIATCCRAGQSCVAARSGLNWERRAMRIMFVVNSLGINEPFGPMILSAVLRAQGHETCLGVIANPGLSEQIRQWNPDVLGYSMMTVDIPSMLAFNTLLRKERKIFTILGGPHATLNPEIIADEGIDAVCVGEGDDALPEVMRRLTRGESLEGIPNILTAIGQPLTMAPLIENLDSLPYMDREIVYEYAPEMKRFGIKGIWASRGCPFKCPYCFNHRINRLQQGKGRIVRKRSVTAMILEAQELKRNYSVKFFRIQDDAFVYQADDWLREFAARWATEVGIPFYCLVRAEFVSEEVVKLLAKAGCRSVSMSIESAVDDIRNRMLRRSMTREHIASAFRICQAHGIAVFTNTMLGLPFTSLQDDIESLDFNIQIKADLPSFSVFMPFPGTDLGDYCRKADILTAEKSGKLGFGMRNQTQLSCFPPEVKRAQYNLCQLGIVAVKFPWLRDFIVKRLIHWRPNLFFILVNYLVAMHAYGTKIFPFRHSPLEYVELIKRTTRHFLYDLTRKNTSGSLVLEELGASSKALTEQERLEALEKCMAALETGRPIG